MVVLRCKVAVLGDGTVGKTALIQMAFSGGVTFPKNYMLTMGVDLCVKEVQVDQHTTVELYLYDVGGQDVYVKNAGDFMAQMDAFMVVFDIGNKITFEGVHKWVEKVRQLNPGIPGVMVANKMDLKDKAEVTDLQGETYAAKHSMALFQASALRGVGTIEPMNHIAADCAQRYEERARQCAQMLGQ